MGNNRVFCKTCGSRMPTDKYTHITIPSGTLDSDPGVKAVVNIFTNEKAPWHEVTDALLCFFEQAPQEFWAEWLKQNTKSLIDASTRNNFSFPRHCKLTCVADVRGLDVYSRFWQYWRTHCCNSHGCNSCVFGDSSSKKYTQHVLILFPRDQ
ncbi:MAG TPA: hypothetical protein EYQ14_11120 [Gammaproteobacteria bacterium]|nr:hypothetical protein [Gammaproteobacteria bacterium]